MPKSTFYNLDKFKKDRVIDACKKEFEENGFLNSKVSNIILRLGVARGTFYKYFVDIEDCYFYMLLSETKQIHTLFIELINNEKLNLESVLDRYGKQIVEEIYDSKKRVIYRSRYMDFNPIIEKKWKIYCEKNFSLEDKYSFDYEDDFCKGINILGVVIRDIIKNSFLYDWNKDTFLKKYNEQNRILLMGLENIVKEKKYGR